jgi:hypothetical protein
VEYSTLYQQGNSDDGVQATSGMQTSVSLTQEHSLECNSILHREDLGNDDRDLPSPSMESIMVPAQEALPVEPLSRSDPLSDEGSSPHLERSGCVAAMAARTVAQVMAMQAGQARLRSELQVDSPIL